MNEKYADILKLARVEIIIIPIFVFCKCIRPSVLDSASPEVFKLILLSLPNFFEAVIGTLTLTGVGLMVVDRIKSISLKPKRVYLMAAYVIAQELNLIALRSNTTMDLNDVVYSLIGLVMGYLIVLGIKPRIT